MWTATGSSRDRAPLLPAHGALSASRSSLPRAAFAVLIVLGIATSLALVQVALLSQELRAHLEQRPAPSPPSASPTRLFPAATSTARVLIVYSNGTHLNKLAAAVERGVRQAIAQPEQVRTRLVEDASFEHDVLWADAVILGSHVVNANVEPKMAAFLSGWVFSEDLSHKVGAAFVTSGGLSAGEELTMVNLLHSLLIFRMIIVGGERWTSAFGASAIVAEGPFQPRAQVSAAHQSFPSNCYASDPNAIHDMFKDKAEGLGRRVATVAAQLRAP